MVQQKQLTQDKLFESNYLLPLIIFLPLDGSNGTSPFSVILKFYFHYSSSLPVLNRILYIS